MSEEHDINDYKKALRLACEQIINEQMKYSRLVDSLDESMVCRPPYTVIMPRDSGIDALVRTYLHKSKLSTEDTHHE